MNNKKQIIIDGVDVGGCSVYKNGLCLVTKNKCNARCDYASYYLYEQLARKTQECEELKSELATYKKMLDDPEFMFALTDVKTGEREIWRKLGSKADRYLKALEEIEEIVNKKTETSICSECAYNHIPECKDNCMQDVLENILDIINKAGFNKSERCETRHSESCVVPVEPSIIQEAKGKNHEI